MHAYRLLLSHTETRWPLITSTIARITPGMAVLAMVLMAREAGLSYAIAGLLTGGHQLGIGVAAPVQGKLVDRYGQRAVLIPDGIGYVLGTSVLVALVLSGAAIPVVVAVAVLSGMLYPPTTACVRVLLSKRFPSGREREAAFALTAIAVELGFIIGPLAAVGVAQTAGPGWAVVIAGLLAGIGALGLASTSASRGVPTRPREREARSALGSIGVRTMVLALGAMAVAFGVIDITVPAVAEIARQPAAAGWLIAAIAGGSLIGGLVYGGGVWPGTVVDRIRVLAVVLTAGFAFIPLATSSLTLFAVALFVAGLCLAPLTICAFELIDTLALPGTQTEAQQWTQASVVAGVAVGALLAGIAVDVSGPALAFVVGAVCIGVSAVVLHARARHLVVSPRATLATEPG